MCVSVDDRFVLGVAVVALIVAGLAVRTRVVRGQRGFTGTEGVAWLAIATLVAVLPLPPRAARLLLPGRHRADAHSQGAAPRAEFEMSEDGLPVGLRVALWVLRSRLGA